MPDGTEARITGRQPTAHAKHWRHRPRLSDCLSWFNGPRLCWPRHQIRTSSYVKKERGRERAAGLINMSDEPSSRPSLRLQSNIPLQYSPISASISLGEHRGPGNVSSAAVCGRAAGQREDILEIKAGRGGRSRGQVPRLRTGPRWPGQNRRREAGIQA